MTHDPVNNPSHYNQNGLEVIDVIETYAKDDFRIANVLKYVCRHAYKGKPLEDLRKARWYLERVIKEMEGELKYPCGVPVPDPDIEPDIEADAAETQVYVQPSPDRIAGDTALAQDIKARYYDYDRFAIHGYCANCDAELNVGKPHITRVSGFDESIKFCSDKCVAFLKAWQKGQER